VEATGGFEELGNPDRDCNKREDYELVLDARYQQFWFHGGL
jgi:hypothetical protein